MDGLLNESRSGQPPTMHPCGIADLRQFLHGSWDMARDIDDRRGKQDGRLVGTAVFEPCGTGLICRESGLLNLGTYQGRAKRAYHFCFVAPARAEVSFEGGGHFYTLDLSAGECKVEHRCKDDLYRGIFRVLSPQLSWQVIWQITGPRKDQTLHTHYCRAGKIQP